MSETLSTFQTRVSDYARVPSSVVSSSQVQRAIQDALKRHNGHRPQLLTTSFSSTGYEYNLATLVTSWDRRYTVLEIFGYSSGKRLDLDHGDWRQIYDGTNHKLLVSKYLEFGTSETLYMDYTAPHTLDADTSTLLDEDVEFVAKLAAANVCAQARQEAVDETEGTFDVEVTNYAEQMDRWRKSEQDFRAEYEAFVSRKEIAGGFAEWDILDEYDQRPLFHGGRNF